MNKIRIAHEAPMGLFDYVKLATDYDYALANLYVEVEGYADMFKQSLAEGREVILDNAVYELGEAFTIERFKTLVMDLRPTWYIIPDVLEDSQKTIHNARIWNDVYRQATPGKCIGVVQGKDYYDIVDCYEQLDQTLDVDMIAISFDYSMYQRLVPNPNRLMSWMLGRVTLLGLLEADGVINKNKPHHLLGTSLPVEGKFYRDYPWIYSVDTSNPVVAAIKGVAYEENFGLTHKESQKLFELINYPGDLVESGLLEHNLQEFRKYWNG